MGKEVQNADSLRQWFQNAISFCRLHPMLRNTSNISNLPIQNKIKRDKESRMISSKELQKNYFFGPDEM